MLIANPYIIKGKSLLHTGTEGAEKKSVRHTFPLEE